MRLGHKLLRAGILYAVLWLFMVAMPAHSEEVLMVRWFENAAADKLFEEELRKLRPDIKIRNINAKRDEKLLKALLNTHDLSKIDLVHTFGTNCTRITKKYIGGRVPIVFDAVSTPVLSKIVNSIDKPGNNMTGARMLIDLETQIEVLADITDLKTLGVWYDPREFQSHVVLLKLKKLADKKGITLRLFRMIPDAGQFERMVKVAAKETKHIDALYFVASSSFHLNYKQLHRHLPDTLITMGVLKEYVENGSTFALGPDPRELVRKVAYRAHRILGGEKAGDLPIALLTKKNAVLYVNRKKVNKEQMKKLQGLGMKVVMVE